MFGRIGPMELILILVIALVIFGPKKLPEIGKAVGDAVKAFKKSSENLTEEINKATTVEPPKASAPNQTVAGNAEPAAPTTPVSPVAPAASTLVGDAAAKSQDAVRS